MNSSAEQFADRHIGPSPRDVAHMLDTLGVSSLGELLDQAVPASIRDDKPLELDDALTEPEAIARLRALAGRNRVVTSLIGTGYHGTHTPGVILRNVLENPAWYTAYTPYQPEISQGRLEALLNFQTMVCDLTGMEITNASMLDEGTAAAEAMTLARRSTRHAGNVFFVDAECHPQTVAVVATRAEPLGIEVVVGDPAVDLSPTDAFGVVLQHPGTSGVVRDLRPVVEAVHEAGGLAVVATDLLACTLLMPPGELGADVAVGSSQRFGVPMGFGGPHAGFLATRLAFRRSLPGRLVGVSVDAAGRPAHRLALQTREQHIRREKATSNICTAQVLLAVMASMYAVYHGPEGLRAIARRVTDATTRVAAGLRSAGYRLANDTWFDTLTLRVPGQAADLIDRARAAGINLRRVDADTIGLSLDETTDGGVLRRLATVFGIDGGTWPDGPAPGGPAAGCWTRGRSSRPPTSAGRSRWWPPTCSPSRCSRRPARWAPTSSWARRSASASRSSTAARTPASWRSPGASSVICPAAWSGSRSTPRAGPPTGWRCRPASSTSAATRPPPTSAPPRCCSRWSPRCTPSTTAPRGFGRSAGGPTSVPPPWPPPCAPPASGWRTTPGSTPSPSGCRGGPPTWWWPDARSASTCASSTPTAWACPPPSARARPPSPRCCAPSA
ncbi:MAG TPA: hypothetical protein VF015_08280 [Acidimicrobiales bacterium]